MIQYGQYTREDGTQCSAVLFSGNSAGADHLFEILEILNAAGLKAKWVDAVQTDELLLEDGHYPVFDENDELVFRIDPEHIVTEESKEVLKVSDYIVMRDGDTYLQDGRTFEAIWTSVSTELTDLGEFFQARKALGA